MLRGREFQSLGPATEKALSPLVFSLDLGQSKSNWSVDLSALTGVCKISISDKYDGP